MTRGCRQGMAVVRPSPKILVSTSLSLCSLSLVVSLDDCASACREPYPIQGDRCTRLSRTKSYPEG